MSQADAAPNTGDPFSTDGKSVDPTASRRGLLAGAGLAMLAPLAAAARPVPPVPVPDRQAWDRAYHEYQRLKLLQEAYYSLGPWERANDAFDLAKIRRASEPAAFERAMARLSAVEAEAARYVDPVHDAAVALMKTYAPDLAAVAVKIKLHKDELEATDHNEIAWTCILADLERMAV
jgi:hypothetical protein